MKALKKSLPIILLILFELAVGILMIVDAQKFITTAFMVFGILLILVAVIMLLRYLKERKDEEDNPMTLITAILAFIVGAVCTFGSAQLAGLSKLIAILYGAILIVNGVFKIGDYFSLKKEGVAVSGIRLIAGLLSIALGVLIMFKPFEAIGIFVGVSLIVEAVLDVAAIIHGRRKDTSGSIYDTSGDDKDFDLE